MSIPVKSFQWALGVYEPECEMWPDERRGSRPVRVNARRIWRGNKLVCYGMCCIDESEKVRFHQLRETLLWRT